VLLFKFIVLLLLLNFRPGTDSIDQQCGVGVGAVVLARSRDFLFEGQSDSEHVLLLDCTLSLVLCRFSQCTVLAGRAASSVHCLCTFYLRNLLRSTTQSVCHKISPRVGVDFGQRVAVVESQVFLVPES